MGNADVSLETRHLTPDYMEEGANTYEMGFRVLKAEMKSVMSGPPVAVHWLILGNYNAIAENSTHRQPPQKAYEGTSRLYSFGALIVGLPISLIVRALRIVLRLVFGPAIAIYTYYTNPRSRENGMWHREFTRLFTWEIPDLFMTILVIPISLINFVVPTAIRMTSIHKYYRARYEREEEIRSILLGEQTLQRSSSSSDSDESTPHLEGQKTPTVTNRVASPPPYRQAAYRQAEWDNVQKRLGEVEKVLSSPERRRRNRRRKNPRGTRTVVRERNGFASDSSIAGSGDGFVPVSGSDSLDSGATSASSFTMLPDNSVPQD